MIVRLRGDLTHARADGLERAVGGFATDAWLPIVDGFAATMTKAQIEAVSRVSNVASVESNRVAHAFNDSAQAAFGVTQARTDASGLDGDMDANPLSYVPADVVVGVIDTGIDASHPQLNGGKVIGFVDCQTPVSGICTPKAPFDDEGHGTHVAGTIAGDGEGDARYKGVAPGAGLVGIKVLDATGSGAFSEIIAGIQWAVANKAAFGIEAINLSLGADGCYDGTDAASAAVNAAVAGGLVVLVAAGNDGRGRARSERLEQRRT